MVYSIWSNGGYPPSKDSAVRVPDPDTSNTIAFPDTQPGRNTNSCTIDARFGVRCAIPSSPTTPHGAGIHPTVAAVAGRDDTSPFVDENAAASSTAWPRIWRSTGPVLTSSARNWIHASVIVAPAGTSTPTNRNPTVCDLLPDTTNSKSEDVKFTRPLTLPARVGVYVTDDRSVFVGDAPSGPAYLTGRFEATRGEDR